MRKLNKMVYEYFKNKIFFHRNRYAFPKVSNNKYVWAIIPKHGGYSSGQTIHTLTLRKLYIKKMFGSWHCFKI